MPKSATPSGPAALLLVASLTAGLIAAPADWRPVDQTVEDLDLLARSLRRIEPGLNVNGQQTSMFRVAEGAPGHARSHYVRVGPGFRMVLDQPEYLVVDGSDSIALNRAARHEGEYLELIPANAVFDLRPLGQFAGEQPKAQPPPAPNFIDARIDGRVDGRIRTAVEAMQVNSRPNWQRPVRRADPRRAAGQAQAGQADVTATGDVPARPQPATACR